MMPDYIMMSFVIKMHLFRAFSCFTVMVYRHASSVKIHHFHNTHNTVNTYITQHTTKITTHNCNTFITYSICFPHSLSLSLILTLSFTLTVAVVAKLAMTIKTIVPHSLSLSLIHSHSLLGHTLSTNSLSLMTAKR